MSYTTHRMSGERTQPSRLTAALLTRAIILLFLCGSFSTVLGQTHRDSLARAGRKDARNFRLQDTVWKKYKRKIPVTSDYFKPTETVQSNAAILSDSTYVKAYRTKAYQKNRHRRTPWHYALVGGSVVAGTVITGVALILIFVAPKMA